MTENMEQRAAHAADLESWLGRALRRSTLAVLQDFDTRFAPFDIRPTLFTLLVLIERDPGSSGAQLSERMEIPRAHTVLLLKELERRGLLVRTRQWRTQAISLSEEGRALMPSLHAAHARHMATFDNQMTAEERALLFELLGRIRGTGSGRADVRLSEHGHDADRPPRDPPGS